MASSLMLLQLLPFLCLHWLIFVASTSSNEIPKQPYIVYMGSSSRSNLIIQNGEDVEIAKLNHMQLLSSIIPSEESERLSLIHHYKHAFKGFSAILTDSEASALSGYDHVVSVFPDPVLQLHTTRSWDFLAAAAKPAKNTWFNHKYHKAASDIIIGVIDTDPMDTRGRKIAVAENVEAQGLIFINDDEKIWPTERGILPYAEVGKVAGFRIIKYINSNKNPTATILPTVTIPRHRPAPVVAYFSSRGPGLPTENILKPDVAAPGVAVLAAIFPRPDRPGGIPAGEKPATYALRSGTSMACPHVTGAAAFIKSVRRKWTYSMIKSALMTTATVYDNTGTPLTNSSGNNANPHEMGAGEINPLKALNPGLVFKTTIKDYLRFLCYYGYSKKNIRSMTNTTFNCPKKSSAKLISNINYPSISISKLARQGAIRTVKRTVTNVGSPNATYISMVNAPSGLAVKVFPQKLTFVEGIIKLSFKASFFGKEASSGYNYGSITWSDDRHSVRMMFAVDVE